MNRLQSLCVLAAVVSCCAAVLAQVKIDDFERTGDPQWDGGSKLPNGEKSLSLVTDAERGSTVLRAKLIYDSQPIFITKTLKEPIPLWQCKSIAFWYKLTTKDLSPERALVCRLRTGPNAFTDYIVAAGPAVEPGKWTRAEIDLEHPKKVVNIYNSYFSTVAWLTFRLDGVEGKRVEYEFFADDVQIEMKSPPAPNYQPQIVSREPATNRCDALVIKNSAACYYGIERAIRSLPFPTSLRTLKFRGLHFPIFDFPQSREELMRYQLIALIDVDPYVMPMDHVKWLSDFVASGGALLLCGGPNTFGRAKDFKEPLADLLPVAMVKENDLASVGVAPAFSGPHPISAGIAPRLGRVSKAHLLKLKQGATAVLSNPVSVPPAWGVYLGGGPHDAELRATSDAHSGKGAAELMTRDFYKDPKTGKPVSISVALILGDSNGYSGQDAYHVQGNTRYDFSFFLKGDVPSVQVEGLGWNTLDSKPADRQHIKTSLATITPDAQWRQYQGSLTTLKDTCRLVLAFRVTGTPETLKLGQRIVVDDAVLQEPGSDRSILSNGGCEEGQAVPILAVGEFHKGRVAVLNAFPEVGDRLEGDFFTSDPYDDLMEETLRWLIRAEPAIKVVRFDPPPRHIRTGETAAAQIGVDLGGAPEAKLLYRCVQGEKEIARQVTPLAANGPAARIEVGPLPAGDYRLSFDLCDAKDARVSGRSCELSVHSAIEGEVRFRFGKSAVAPGGSLRFRVLGKKWTGEGYAPPEKPLSARARLTDPAGEVVAEIPAKAMGAEKDAMPFADFACDLPDLSQGAYRVEAEVLDGGAVVSAATGEFHVVDRLDLSTFYPIMSIIGAGGGHQEDEELIRNRVDDLLAHHFNVGAVCTVTAFKEWDAMPHSSDMRNYTEAYAQSKGMGLIYEYQGYTDLRAEHPAKPCVHSKDYRAALEQHVAPYLAVGATVPRLISIKVLDEPSAGPKAMDSCEDCRRVWRERFGTDMPKLDNLAKADLLTRRCAIEFIRDYVAKGYAEGHDIKAKAGAPWDLLLTFCSPAYGYARDLAKSQEDLLWWGATADRMDFDVYPYFYPVSDKIVFLQAHFCMALMRNAAQHLRKPWGFYVELDDRNYPMQINPVEASSECAMTAVAQGADYLNSFINQTFGTGVQARPERWEHLGKTLAQVESAGPLLNVAVKPPARAALLFPYTHWELSGKAWAPHYAYQLLLRAFGEADLLHEEVVRREGGFRCKALALLETDYLPDDIAEKVVRFVQDGGLLLCDRVPKFNETGRPCKLPADLFSGAGTGKGKAVMFSSPLDADFKAAVEDGNREEAEALRSRVKGLLFGHGLRPRALADDPEFEIGWREASDTIVLAAVNHGGQETETSVTLFAPPFEIGFLRDADGHEYTLTKIEQGAQFPLRLKPRCGLLLFAYPNRPAELRLDSATARVKRGGTLRYRLAVLGPGAAPCKGQFVIHGKAVDPKGQVHARYFPSMRISDGAREVAVPVAVNAPKGAWRLECPDPFTGQTRVASFEVE